MCFFSKGSDCDDDNGIAAGRCASVGSRDGFLSIRERTGLEHLSREDGDGAIRPLVSFSLPRWGRDDGLREEGAEFVRVEVRRPREAESVRTGHGIFSRLTTGRDTLHRKRKQMLLTFWCGIESCSFFLYNIKGLKSKEPTNGS